MAGRVIGTATINVRANTASLTASLRAAEKQGSSAFSGLRSSAGKLATALGAIGLGRLATEAVRFGGTYRIQLDNAKAAIDGLTDSAAESDKLMREMTEFAINTPFKLPGVQEATAQLLAVGEGFGVTSDNVLDYVETYGDAIAITGGSEDTLRRVVRNFGQMSSKGKVLGRDMNDLGNAIPGFNAWKSLADGLGTTEAELRKFQEAGKLDELVSGDEAVKILTEGIKNMDGAAGAMERKMNTLGGSIEYFKDSMGIALADGLQPFFEVVRNVLKDKSFQDALVGLADVFAELASTLLAELVPVLPTLVQGFTAIFTALMPLMPTLATVIDVFGRLLVVVAPIVGLIAEGLAGAVAILLPLVEALFPVLDEVVAILSGALAAVMPTIIEAFVMLSEALAPVVDELGDQLVEVLMEMLPLLPPLAELFIVLVEAILPLLPAAVEVSAVWTDAMTTILEVTVPILTKIIEWLTWLADKLEWLTRKIAEWVGKVIGWFRSLYNTLVGNSIIPDLVNGIIYWFSLLLTTVSTIVNTIRTVVVAVWTTIKTTVTTIVSGLQRALSVAWQGIKSTASTVWNGIKRVVTDPISAAVDLLEGFVETIKSILSFTGLESIVGGVFGGVKDAILGPLESAANAVGGIVSRIRGPIESVKNLASSGGKLNPVNWFANGGVFDRPTIVGLGEAGAEAIIPLTNPLRAMQLMQQTGLDRLATQIGNQTRGFDGPLVSMPGAVIQDATDADLVAQRTLVAMQAAMVA